MNDLIIGAMKLGATVSFRPHVGRAGCLISVSCCDPRNGSKLDATMTVYGPIETYDIETKLRECMSNLAMQLRL